MPTEISRSKIDLYIECKRCFYLYAKHSVKRPWGFPFTLNNAVDLLLKKEFDHYRGLGQPHPLMTAAGIDAIPAQNVQMDRWRHNFTGVSYNDAVRDFRVFGAIDDLWLGKDGQHLVVDYKATAKAAPVVALDQEWHAGYKRQMEVYQWLLRQNGLDVSDTAYFVYCTGDNTKAAFDAHLDFTINVIPYHGDASWVDGVLDEIKACLDRTATPDPSESCDYCNYREKVGEYLE